MSKTRLAGTLLAAGLLAGAGYLGSLAVAGAGPLHSNPCHSAHTCPSDHHTYVWTDPRTGLSWSCAKPGAPEYDPSLDTTTIIWDGLTYYCRPAGGPPPQTTTTTTTTPPTTAPEPTTTAANPPAACGIERWTVKTLQDRPRLLPVKSVTLAYLVSRPAPSSLPPTRLPFERHVFRVHARVTLVRHEKDSDLHLVLRDGPSHMIAEAPSPSCTTKATAVRRNQMAQARAAVRVCAKAVVTGVAFFDFKHGQTGVAPNAIELHPTTGFRCLP